MRKPEAPSTNMVDELYNIVEAAEDVLGTMLHSTRMSTVIFRTQHLFRRFQLQKMNSQII